MSEAVVAGAGSKPFQIGLSLSGAVSAGAYSAGVLDFLIEALSEWHDAKQRGEPGVPRHDVFISVMAGASAGGVAAALGALSASAGLRKSHEEYDRVGRVHYALPALFEAWVKRPRLMPDQAGGKDDGMASLLDIHDLVSGTDGASPVASLFNANVLDLIAREVMGGLSTGSKRYPFFSDPMHLFLTLTNLDGVPYKLGLGSEVMIHADRAHFSVSGLGTTPYPSEECSWLSQWGDTGVTLDLAKPLLQTPPRPEVEMLVDAVLGTCAYPMGLAARRIPFRPGDYGARAWTIESSYLEKFDGKPIACLWRSELDKERRFDAVDGGVTDNDPFSLARFTIRDMKADRNPREAEKADRAVISIAPFAEAASAELARSTGAPGSNLPLLAVAGQLLPAMTRQARLKITDVLDAEDPDTFSRYMITPSAPTTRKRARGDRLACAAVAAFGGFIDESFRAHDFQLGRRNCQRFLDQHFTLDAINPVFAGNASGPDSAPRPGRSLPIIPLCGSAREEVTKPGWPSIDRAKLVRLEKRAEVRLNALAGHLLAPLLAHRSAIVRWGVRRFLIASEARTLSARLSQHVEAQLRETGQFRS